MPTPIANSNAAAAIATSGNYCAITTFEPTTTQQGSGQFSCPLITNASYLIVGSTATGTVTFQELASNGTWNTLATPAAITLAATNSNGAIAGSFHGLRINVASLAVASIPYAELKGTVVAF